MTKKYMREQQHKNWTISPQKLLNDVKIGDILCLQCYGGAKRWGRYKGTKTEWSGISREYVEYHVIENYYYKSYYDRHLTGRSKSVTMIGVNNTSMTYPSRQCKRR